MSYHLYVFVHVEGIPEKQRLPLAMKALAKTLCRKNAILRRMESYPWVQIDGLDPQQGETTARKISTELKTPAVFFEGESTSNALRYIKYDWHDGQYGQEVVRWVYGVKASGRWEVCQGDPKEPEFAHIQDVDPEIPIETDEASDDDTFVIPKNQLIPPSVFALGDLHRLPGIDMSSGEWSEEVTYQPPAKAGPTNFFELFRSGYWTIEEVEELLAQGVDPNRMLRELDPNCPESDATPLEEAIAAILMTHARVQKTVALLLRAGADPNQMGGLNTPIYDAVEWGTSQLVETLLRAGAKVDRVHDRDETTTFEELLRTANSPYMKKLLVAAAEKERANHSDAKKPNKPQE